MKKQLMQIIFQLTYTDGEVKTVTIVRDINPENIGKAWREFLFELLTRTNTSAIEKKYKLDLSRVHSITLLETADLEPLDVKKEKKNVTKTN